MSAVAWATVEAAIQAWMVAGSGLDAAHVIWAEQGLPRPTGAYISMRLMDLPNGGRDWIDQQLNVLAVPTLTISGVDTAADTLTITGHNLVTGDGQLQLATTGTLPAPLAAAANVWAVVVDANHIKVATTFQNAIAASPTTIDLTSSGTGTNTLAGTATTLRAGQELISYLRGPRDAQLQLQAFAGVPGGAGSGTPTGATSPRALLHDAITSHAHESRHAALATAGVAVLSFDPVQSVGGVVNTTSFEPRAIATVHLSLASELSEFTTIIQVINATNQIVTPPVGFTVSLP